MADQYPGVINDDAAAGNYLAIGALTVQYASASTGGKVSTSSGDLGRGRGLVSVVLRKRA